MFLVGFFVVNMQRALIYESVFNEILMGINANFRGGAK